MSELIARGLIVRVVSDADRRAKPLKLTNAGAALLAQVEPLFLARQEAMRRTLSEQERGEFDRLLGKMICAMPDWVEEE